MVDQVLPSTDEDCKFDLERSLITRKITCIPEDKCESKYKFGDLHFGRTCRLSRNYKQSHDKEQVQKKEVNISASSKSENITVIE